MERAKIRAVRWDSDRAHMNAADRVDGLDDGVSKNEGMENESS